MPDPHDPNLPDPAEDVPQPPVDESHVEAMLGAAEPVELSAEEMQAATNATRMMTNPTGGGAMWQPPSIEEAGGLFPNYEVLSLLGRGGMGAVYKARQIQLDRLVAIKLLPLEISADADFADRFRREARAMAKLEHPNIIGVYDFGTTTAGHLFFAMAYVEGTNLHQIIHGPGLTPQQTLEIVGSICDALAYAHSKGIVHRDIKPANVMISTEGQVKMADFGLARLTDPSVEQMGHTMTGTVMGTPDYMAPEQMRGMNVDHRADIYSLGVMLYEMLCKDVPRGIFDPPSERAGVDTRIDEVVKRAMQQQPERRYQQTGEMKADVDQVRAAMVQPTPSLVAAVSDPAASKERAFSIHGQSATAAPPDLSTRITNPRSLGLILAAAALVVGAIAFFTLKQKDDSGVPPVKTAQTIGVPPVPPSPAAAVWQPLITATTTPPHLPGKREWSEGRLHLLLNSVNAEKPQAEGAIRARIRFQDGSRSIGITARSKSTGEGYKLNVLDSGSVSLNVFGAAGQRLETLGRHTFPKPLAAGDVVTLELRAQGDRLTGLVNGTAVIEARDTRYPDAGTWGILADDGWFETAEFLPLDGAGSTVHAAPPPAATEPWRDWVAEERAKGGLRSFESDGTYIQQRNATGGPTIKANTRDGAIRITWKLTAPIGKPGMREPGIVLRHGAAATPPKPERCVLNFARAGLRIDLHTVDAAGNPQRIELKSWPLPAGFDPAQEHTMELRVVGDELSVRLNGQLIGTHRDSRATSGGFGFFPADGALIRKVEYLILDPTQTTAALAAEPWQDLLREPANLGLDDGVKQTPEGLSIPPQAKVTLKQTWGTGRDGVVRMKTTFGGPRLELRARSGAKGFYTLMASNENSIILQRWDAALQKTVTLGGGFKPRQPLKAGEDYDLELRCAGPVLTAKLNGELLGTVSDEALQEGTFMVFHWEGNGLGVIKSLEFLDLNGAGRTGLPASAATSSTTPPSDAAEKWQDLIAAGGWRAPWKIENGVLTRPAKTMAQRKWEAGVRDCAWRVTRRWDGGWYDLQLGLRSRGNTGVRLEFLDLPQPDVILVRISSNKQKLAEGKTTRRYKKGDIITIEFRAVGTRITASIDGELLATAEDQTTTSGAYDIWSNYGDPPAYHKVEFLNLDRAP